MKLRDRVALITGAGSGMGRATARLFAAEGARVLVVDVDGDQGKETVRRVEAAGGRAAFWPADVSRVEDARGMVDACVRQFGRLDVCFNNAGIPMSATPIEEVPEALLDRILAVNVRGVYLGCQQAVPVMKRQGGGVIINTASTAGVRPRPGLSAYNMSKGAVLTLTRSLAAELAPFRIRVVAISPVASDTPMLPGFFRPGIPAEEAREAFLATIPLGRFCTAEDVARAALFLASDDAAMVTGSSVDVDGGRLL
ncbi:MAG: SDR family oxidoreductase [Candidatus Rokuibacteriota bacterium]